MYDTFFYTSYKKNHYFKEIRYLIIINESLMVHLFCPITHLISENDIDFGNIVFGEKFTGKISEFNRRIIGEGLFLDIKNSFIYYQQYNNFSVEDFYSIQNTIPYINQGLLFALWIIRDHSCYSCISMLTCDDNVNTNILQSGSAHTNAKGTYQNSFFDINDFVTANQYLEQIHSLIEVPTDRNEVIEFFGKNLLIHTDYTRFSNLNCIEISMGNINSARSTVNVLSKISFYIVALEALFASSGETDNLSFKLSYRVPVFLNLSLVEKEDIYSSIKQGYEVRSKVFHGDILSVKKAKNEYLEGLSFKLDDILRKVFRMILADQGKRKVLMDKTSFQSFFHSSFIGDA